jgi:hypothetical protein
VQPTPIDPSDKPVPAGVGWKLFLASFLALYFELLVIRYVSTELTVFGVLKNLPLIASFFGLGIGMLRAGNTLLARRAFVFVALALLLLARFGFHVPLPALGWEYGVSVGSHTPAFSVLAFLVSVTVILWLIVGFFLVLGNFVGEQLDQLPPLSAYGVNLAGSLAGILALVPVVSANAACGLVSDGLPIVVAVYLATVGRSCGLGSIGRDHGNTTAKHVLVTLPPH